MTDRPSAPSSRAQGGAWKPLGNPLFRALWIASLISSLGTWIQQVATSWLMTTLHPQPFLVSLVQVATTLPMALMALPAGVLADKFDRRLYLLATQTWMAAGALGMAILAANGIMTPEWLLGCTFFMGLGVALNSPAWHALTPEIVPRSDLPQAIALQGLILNGAKAIGPALGGAILLWRGPSWAFLLNALSFLAVIAVLLSWKRQAPIQTLPPEPVFIALKAGFRFVRHSPHLRIGITRASIFLLGSSSLWALLPLISREEYHTDEWGYGVLIASFGGGAILLALILPRLRHKLSLNRLATLATLIFSSCLISLANLAGGWPTYVVMMLAGAAWLSVLSGLHLVIQSSAPPWVQARAMSIYLLFFFTAASLGSAIWGGVAQHYGLRQSLNFAAGILFVSTFVTRFLPLHSRETISLHPSSAWAQPKVTLAPPLEHGPIVIVVEYEIDPLEAASFQKAVHELRNLRLQNGALRWGLFVDLANRGRYQEVYVEESWGNHLRQHERISEYEQDLAKTIYAFHQGPNLPKVFHYATCDQQFPRRSNKPGLPPRVYPATTGGVPLWFTDGSS